jgi:hypothetical protein
MLTKQGHRACSVEILTTFDRRSLSHIQALERNFHQNPWIDGIVGSRFEASFPQVLGLDPSVSS